MATEIKSEKLCKHKMRKNNFEIFRYFQWVLMHKRALEIVVTLIEHQGFCCIILVYNQAHLL